MTQSLLAQAPAYTAQRSFKAPALPPYTEFSTDDTELAKLSTTSTGSTVYAAAKSLNFKPTTQLQIQTRGRGWLVLPFIPTRPDAIAVFGLTADGQLDRPQYLSLRDKRCSGSCRLVSGDDESETPLTSTTYRFGPGRRPKVNLAHLDDPAHQEGFEIEASSLVSRAVTLRTSLGVFRWRYAGRRERAAESANSLLVLELLRDGRDAGRQQEEPIKIAHLVRNEQYRTAGTRPSTAGNGGRLVLDLSQIDEKNREYAQQLVVTTALVMLKKEVDRRRFAQFMIFAAMVSGGP